MQIWLFNFSIDNKDVTFTILVIKIFSHTCNRKILKTLIMNRKSFFTRQFTLLQITIQESKAEYERRQHCDHVQLSAGQRECSLPSRRKGPRTPSIPKRFSCKQGPAPAAACLMVFQLLQQEDENVLCLDLLNVKKLAQHKNE